MNYSSTYDLEVQIIAKHDVARLEITVAHLKLAVKVLEEDDELGNVDADSVDWQPNVFRYEVKQGPERDVLHQEEQTVCVLRQMKKKA